MLVYKIVSRLLPKKLVIQEPQKEEETLLLSDETPKRDVSYEVCIASWAKHIVDTWESSPQDGDNEIPLDRHEVVATIISAIGPQKAHLLDEEKG